MQTSIWPFRSSFKAYIDIKRPKNAFYYYVLQFTLYHPKNVKKYSWFFFLVYILCIDLQIYVYITTLLRNISFKSVQIDIYFKSIYSNIFLKSRIQECLPMPFFKKITIEVYFQVVQDSVTFFTERGRGQQFLKNCKYFHNWEIPIY